MEEVSSEKEALVNVGGDVETRTDEEERTEEGVSEAAGNAGEKEDEEEAGNEEESGSDSEGSEEEEEEEERREGESSQTSTREEKMARLRELHRRRVSHDIQRDTFYIIAPKSKYNFITPLLDYCQGNKRECECTVCNSPNPPVAGSKAAEPPGGGGGGQEKQTALQLGGPTAEG